MKILVQRRRSFILPLVVILVFSASAAVGWKYIQTLQTQQIKQIDGLALQYSQLLEDYELLLKDKRLAEQKVDMLQQTAKVDAQAYAKVNEYLKSIQNKLVDLKEEASFYRDIVANSNTGSVHIKNFGIRAGAEVGSFKYQLVLTRGTRNDKVIEGRVNLTIEGVLKGQKIRLGPKDLGQLGTPELEYQFKYFQRLEGRIVLPENFNPKRIIIKLTATSNPKRPLRKSFDWAAINS